MVHFSVQSDHIHLLVEGDSREALIRGNQGLAIRCARAVNRAAHRTGSVWSDRYHSHVLTTPRETRRALAYVLLNHCKHLRAVPGIDPCSSAAWFDGWRHRPFRTPEEEAATVAARTWLLSTGWRRAGGAIALSETPRRVAA